MRYNNRDDEPSFLDNTRRKQHRDDLFTRQNNFSQQDNPVREMLDSSPKTREEQEMTRKKYMQQSNGFMYDSPYRKPQQQYSSTRFYIILLIIAIVVVLIIILVYVFSNRKPTPNASNGYGNAPPPGYYDPRAYPYGPPNGPSNGGHPPRRTAPPQEMNQAINNKFPPNQPGLTNQQQQTQQVQQSNDSDEEVMNIVNGEDENVENQNTGQVKKSKKNKIKNDKIRRKQMRLKKMQSRNIADRDSAAMDKVRENLETDNRYKVLKKSNFKPDASNDLVGTRVDQEESDPDE